MTETYRKRSDAMHSKPIYIVYFSCFIMCHSYEFGKANSYKFKPVTNPVEHEPDQWRKKMRWKSIWILPFFILYPFKHCLQEEQLIWFFSLEQNGFHMHNIKNALFAEIRIANYSYGNKNIRCVTLPNETISFVKWLQFAFHFYRRLHANFTEAGDAIEHEQLTVFLLGISYCDIFDSDKWMECATKWVT